MNIRSSTVTIAAIFGLATLTLTTIHAAPAALEGTVRDSKWRPVRNANVRIEATNGSQFSNTVKTDAKGHYAFSDLEAGTYHVILLVNGTVKAAITNAHARSGESRKLNFDLTGRYGAKATHLVYVSEKTDSNLGGHWIEVDDNQTANIVSAHNIQTLRRFNTSGNDGFPPRMVEPPFESYPKVSP